MVLIASVHFYVQHQLSKKRGQIAFSMQRTLISLSGNATAYSIPL